MPDNRKTSRRSFFMSATMGTVALSSLGMKEELSVAQNNAGTNPQPCGLRIVTFKVDVTPPVGDMLAYVSNNEIGSPIYVSGIVLDDGKTRTVWVSCDYIYICGESYVMWVEMIAKQAETVKENVFLHAVHQHDSIRWAPEYNAKPSEAGRLHVSLEYCEKSLKDVSEAIAQAVGGPWQSVGKLLTAENRLGGLASTRRLVKDGKCVGWRGAGENFPAIQAWPVGTIDPILRTVCFENTDGRRIVALHFYAVHPMAVYLKNRVGSEVPGRALRHVAENNNSVALNIYFNGCAAPLGLGKYICTSVDDIYGIDKLGKRLGEGMLKNLRHLEEQPLSSIEVKRVAFEVPFKPSLQPASDYANGPHGAEFATQRRYLLETLDRWRQSSVARMSLGPGVHFLSFELSEVFVDYQLYAQSLIPEHFLATAAYGNGVYWYIPNKEAYEEGDYEVSDKGSIVTSEIDGILREALRKCFAEVIYCPGVF